MNKPTMSAAKQPPGALATAGPVSRESVETAGAAAIPPPASDAVANKWRKHVGSARIVWSRLSNEELLLSRGDATKLIGMVQERYALDLKEAGRRVRNFLQQYKLPDA